MSKGKVLEAQKRQLKNLLDSSKELRVWAKIYLEEGSWLYDE